MAQVIPVVCFLVGVIIGGAVGAVVTWVLIRQQIAAAITQANADSATQLAVLQERTMAQNASMELLMSEKATLSAQFQDCEGRREQLSRESVEAQTRLAEERDKTQSERNLLFELKAELTDVRNLLARKENEATALSTTLKEERQQNAEKMQLLDEAQRKLSDAFKAMAAEALKSNNESFLHLAKTAFEQHHETAKGDFVQRQQAIDALIKPVGESLSKVDAKIAEIEKARAEAYGGLTQQVTSMIAAEEKLRMETSQLVKALRAPIVRGRWGEIQLRRVVEMAGMVDHCDFFEQESVNTDEGRQRVDLLVRLPGNANIVVDSKVPLVAFLEAMEAADETSRVAKLREHARHVANHVEQLGKKSYWEQFQPSPDLVVLFLPGEHFYTSALEQMPDLIERGVEQRVVIATPMTLISLLRAVAMGWRQERLAQSAEEISRLGKELYERICKMSEHFSKVGRNLGQAIDAYNQTVGALESRVLVSARRFRELGTSNADDIEEVLRVDKVPRTLAALEFVTDAVSDEKLLPGKGSVS